MMADFQRGSQAGSQADSQSSAKLAPRVRKYMDAAALFRCPVCAARSEAAGSQQPSDAPSDASALELRPFGAALRCAAGHTFDVSRKGYVNFIPAQKPLKGYTKEFFDARREFLSWGYYDHVLGAVVDAVRQFATPDEVLRPLRILDAGCAEGYYLRGIAQAFRGDDGIGTGAVNRDADTSGAGAAGAMPGPMLIGADISKDAIRLAASGGDPNLWIVADVANLPLADASVDCVLNVFTPANYREFARVLRPGGVLIKVVPGPRHLEQLREAIGDGAHSESDVLRIFGENCTERATIPATQTFDVPAERQSTLLDMTPLAFRFSDAERRQLRVPRITIDARVLVGVLR